MGRSATMGALFSSWEAAASRFGEEDLLKSVRADICDTDDVLNAVREEMSALSPAGRDLLMVRSVETPTHFKWCLAGGEHRGLRVWLHTYKPWIPGEDRHAASIHDHRYSFVSAVLAGELRERRWRIHEGRITAAGDHRRPSGETYAIAHSEIHSLGAVAPGTATLLVQAPAAKPFSTVYDPASRQEKAKHFDLAHTFTHLPLLTP
ncbi:hypothetical protein OHS33_12200 [Streptomyces sp. NBC_00536]|uniref:hypothetical protein n=1 Tax=Streptomyces sp. NBC_00536 TaxID=2975769 RepID=UPI002E802BA5|nr:hypothetical protein [Streptomyces sp. NBC_00536]WUC79032.1 hypothetical protein OHS33_12200 [Streptomyces sp. NBC_00536]